MTLLDSIFSGERSITALLANTFAGNAMVVCPGKQGAYDPVTNTYEKTENTEYNVKFIQEALKRNVLTHVDGVQIEAGDLVGVIPAYMIKDSIRKQVDYLRRNGVDYRINATEDISSGDEVALVRILCKKSAK